MANIDCPEKKQAFGSAAKNYTAKVAFGKNVSVTVTGHDRYQRSIGDVRLPNGKDLNEQLVSHGLAWWREKYCHDDKIAALEEKAREKRTGLWSDSSSVPPLEFRKSQQSNDAAVQ